MTDDDLDEWLSLAQYSSSAEVQMVRLRLEGEGIECLILDELSTTLRPHHSFATGGIRLQVRRREFKKAAALLGLRIQEREERYQCPSCGSREIYSRDLALPRLIITFPIFILSVILFPIGLLLFGIYKFPMRCRSCGHLWKLRPNSFFSGLRG